MSDGRSNRKAKVVPFLDRLERDRNENLKSLIDKAKLMKLEGFESVVWDAPEWQVNAGRLVKLTGKTRNQFLLVFRCHRGWVLSHSSVAGSWLPKRCLFSGSTGNINQHRISAVSLPLLDMSHMQLNS